APARDAGRLILITADGQPFLPADLLRVDAALTSPVQPAPARPLRGTSPAERPLAGDPSAWTPLVLWGEALLIVALFTAWARVRWGRPQAWLGAVPVSVALGLPAPHPAPP